MRKEVLKIRGVQNPKIELIVLEEKRGIRDNSVESIEEFGRSSGATCIGKGRRI